MQKPKVTAEHISIHKAAQAAVKHLAKLPPGIRKQLGSLAGKHLNYSSKMFHKKVALPHQNYNVKNWKPYGPTFKC